MDITIPINGIRLNLRTAVILETRKGYIFEKDLKNGFYWIAGGRIQINETSEEAAKREIKEELNMNIENIKLKAIMESFFELEKEKFHEICFYYRCKTNQDVNLPKNFYAFSREELNTVHIEPKILLDIINSESDEIVHLTIHE